MSELCEAEVRDVCRLRMSRMITVRGNSAGYWKFRMAAYSVVQDSGRGRWLIAVPVSSRENKSEEMVVM